MHRNMVENLELIGLSGLFNTTSALFSLCMYAQLILSYIANYYNQHTGQLQLVHTGFFLSRCCICTSSYRSPFWTFSCTFQVACSKLWDTPCISERFSNPILCNSPCCTCCSFIKPLALIHLDILCVPTDYISPPPPWTTSRVKLWQPTKQSAFLHSVIRHEQDIPAVPADI